MLGYFACLFAAKNKQPEKSIAEQVDEINARIRKLRKAIIK